MNKLKQSVNLYWIIFLMYCVIEKRISILKFFAMPIRDLIKSNICIIINGIQGSGKTILLNFMGKYVFGENLYSAVASVKGLLY